jgi:hypothetical protein
VSAISFCIVGETWFNSWGESYNPDLASLFRKSDAVVDDEGELDFFQVTSSQMLDRMHLLGIDLAATEAAFRDAFTGIPKEHRPARFDFSEWLSNGCEAIRKSGYFGYEIEYDWIDYGVDVRYIMRALIEMHPGEVPVIWNLADVILRSHVPPDPDLCELEIQKRRAAAVTNLPVIVLTEGSTDAETLRGSLEVIYPHLVDFLKFMDFGSGVEGGASALLRTVKSFAASGIANRVIAIFDNDTAAAEVLSSLRGLLPQNFRVVQYPHIALASSYPTVGPSGHSLEDVNGRAASLELYFGEDVLRQADGGLTPVQWTGYSKKQASYQGEILNKVQLQKRFRAKLNSARSGGGVKDGEDWSGIIGILDALRSAFSSPPAER